MQHRKAKQRQAQHRKVKQRQVQHRKAQKENKTALPARTGESI